MAALLAIWLSVLAFVASAQNPPQGFLYWISPSCTARDPDFWVYPQEVFYQARSAAARLADPADTDFKRVFHAIFKTTWDDATLYNYPEYYRRIWGDRQGTAFEIVSATLTHLSTAWKNTTNRDEASFRIFCDDQARLQPSNPYDPDLMWDPVDQTYITVEQGKPFCQSKDYLYGLTTPLWTRPADPSLAFPFATVDICATNMWKQLDIFDNTLNIGKKPAYQPRRLDKVQLTKQAWQNVDLRDLDLDGLSMYVFPVYTLLHEWLHAPPYWFEDWYPRDDPGNLPVNFPTAAWEYVVKLTTEWAVINPEAYTYLGIMAALADSWPMLLGPEALKGGFTFDRYWDTLPEDEKWEMEIPAPTIPGGVYYNRVVLGHFFAYPDITGQRNLRKYGYDFFE
ncbi:hypothetical protein QBC40DRAFT_17218 [Triangularia verruculosa]|uniref:Uncharacterized protein n=1 Tax=Triangularia verruculosa TaxID=2587418 RepID=A0AAN7B0A1_9PEZI|nr:hypothetical protein QBC40DRAFT_17218 [Triangularia verruculosa]